MTLKAQVKLNKQIKLYHHKQIWVCFDWCFKLWPTQEYITLLFNDRNEFDWQGIRAQETHDHPVRMCWKTFPYMIRDPTCYLLCSSCRHPGSYFT